MAAVVLAVDGCWYGFLLIQSSQRWKQSSCWWIMKLIIRVSLLWLSLSHVFSLSLAESLWSCSSVHTDHLRITRLFNPCCTEPEQHSHIHFANFSLIQSHANIFTFHWPFTCTCVQSLPQARAIIPLHIVSVRGGYSSFLAAGGKCACIPVFTQHPVL